jgi:hypothetical protein
MGPIVDSIRTRLVMHDQVNFFQQVQAAFSNEFPPGKGYRDEHPEKVSLAA